LSNTTNDAAWPSLLHPGEWTVRVVDQGQAKHVTLRNATTDEIIGHELHVPRLQIPTDHLIHQHEFRHVLRDKRRGGHWKASGHKLRDAFRRMVEEVCIELENSEVGVDTRGCRDDLDWSRLHVRDAKDAALWFLQLVHTCTPAAVAAQRSPELQRFWTEISRALDSG
jgi:hypothetical protein